MEDDQLRLRAVASGACREGVQRPPAGLGRFDDLDRIQMLGLLSPASCPAPMVRHVPRLFNPRILRGQPNELDPGWRDANGLRGLRYGYAARRTEGEADRLPGSGGARSVHALVELQSGRG